MKKSETYLKWHIFCVLTLILILFSTTAFGETINVPGNYSTIQAAIDAADPNDTILVADGNYNENVIVDKQLVIKSVNGYSTTTVVGQYRSDHIFSVQANEVTIEGFTVHRPVDGTIPHYMQAGIYLAAGASHCTIANNRCGYDTTHNNGKGIRLNNNDNNTISGNICNWNYKAGIYLENSSNNSIFGNSCNSNYWNAYGMELYYANNNTISENICNSNSEYGIYLGNSNDNTISGNTCSLSHRGIDLGNVSTGNIIIENNFSENIWTGINIRSGNNVFLNNICNSNGIGIYIISANNTISGNILSENDEGLVQNGEVYNAVYLNNFTNNTNYQIIDSYELNKWHSPRKVNYIYMNSVHTGYLGNFYSDHDLIDSDGDGITENPYVVSMGSDDDYPLTAPPDNYSILVLHSLDGDFDLDSDVDGADLSVFAENFGKTN